MGPKGTSKNYYLMHLVRFLVIYTGPELGQGKIIILEHLQPVMYFCQITKTVTFDIKSSPPTEEPITDGSHVAVANLTLLPLPVKFDRFLSTCHLFFYCFLLASLSSRFWFISLNSSLTLFSYKVFGGYAATTSSHLQWKKLHSLMQQQESYKPLNQKKQESYKPTFTFDCSMLYLQPRISTTSGTFGIGSPGHFSSVRLHPYPNRLQFPKTRIDWGNLKVMGIQLAWLMNFF